MPVMVTSRTIGAVVAFAASGRSDRGRGRAIVGWHCSSSPAIAWQVSKDKDIAQLLSSSPIDAPSCCLEVAQQGTSRQGIEGTFEKRRMLMCASCGCGMPEDKHGDDRNINWSEIVASAEANNISATEAIQNMQKMAEQQG